MSTINDLLYSRNTARAIEDLSNWSNISDPAANTDLVTLTAPEDGLYEIHAYLNIGGTTSGSVDRFNYRIRRTRDSNTVTLSRFPSTLLGATDYAHIRKELMKGDVVSINNELAGTSGSAYRQTLILRKIS